MEENYIMGVEDCFDVLGEAFSNIMQFGLDIV
jgi:hypothetical protein